MAKHVRKVEIPKDGEIQISNPGMPEDIIILLKGSLSVTQTFGEDIYFFKNDIIIKGLNLDQGANVLQAKKDSQALLISRSEYFNLLVSETDLIRYVFNENTVKEEGESEEAAATA